MNIKDKFIELVVQYGPRLLVAIAVLVIGFWAVKMIIQMVEKGLKKRNTDVSVHAFIRSLSTIILRILVIITAASALGIPMTTFIAILSSAVIAVGLALKDSLSNFVGGILILFFRPFKVGDFIDAEGTSGTVIEIGILYSTLKTYDNRRITIPNGKLVNARIINFSVEETRLVDLSYRVGFDSDISRVKQILKEIAEAHPLVMKEPAPFVGIKEYADSYIVMALRVWCLRKDYWTIYYEMNELVKDAFDKNDITMPFPQRDVHIYNEKE